MVLFRLHSNFEAVNPKYTNKKKEELMHQNISSLPEDLERDQVTCEALLFRLNRFLFFFKRFLRLFFLKNMTRFEKVKIFRRFLDRKLIGAKEFHQ